jgi:hypothetical protein
MRFQIFELFKRYGFSQTTFFREIRDTNIHSKSFLNFVRKKICVVENFPIYIPKCAESKFKKLFAFRTPYELELKIGKI